VTSGVGDLALATPSRDGGHDAIKGFAFQFDASLLHILDNPTKRVELEGAQDIEVQNYHVQVKRRSRSFTLAQIAKAVQQMMRQFNEDPGARFALHCHFPDRSPGSVLRLSRVDLDSLLSQSGSLYGEDVKDWFIKSFQINFSSDYEAQFDSVLQRLKAELNARDDAEAICWHAVIHGHLRDLIIGQAPGSRWVSKRQIIDLVHDARTAVFEGSYAQFYGHDKYLKLMRGQYKMRTVNVPKRERLFIVECSAGDHAQDIFDLVARLRDRYFKGASPAPYVSFRGLADIVPLKRALWDNGLYFYDGHGYNSAEFSVGDIVTPPIGGFGIKILDVSRIGEVAPTARYAEVHDFFQGDRHPDPDRAARTRHVLIRNVADISKILR
jgi:hypothetical protein